MPEQEVTELDDLFDDLEVSEPEPEVDTPEEPVVEEVVEEPEPVVKEEPKSKPEVVKTEVVEESLEEKGEPEPDVEEETPDLATQNEALLARIEELSGQVIMGVPPPVMEPSEPAQPAVVETPAKVATDEVANYLEGVSIEELLESPEKFNTVLNQVATTSAQRAENAAVERTLRSIPELVVGYITRHSAMNRMVDDFYKENPDLSNVKKTVAAVANDLHSKNTDWTVEKVFGESAKSTRKLLGLKEKAQEIVTSTTKKKPAFAKQRGARGGEPKIDGLQKEINDLLSDNF